MTPETIRDVEGIEIQVSEIWVEVNWPWIVALLFGAFSVISFFYIQFSPEDFGKMKFFVFVMLPLIVAIFLIVVVGVFGMFSVPGYYVRLNEGNVSGISIPKTNPAADQIAVCKAANDLEPKARELAKNKRELASIAAGCKKEGGP